MTATFTGWGRTVTTRSRLLRSDLGDIAHLWSADADGGVLPRGNGRGYGDVALNDGGTLVRIWDTSVSGDPASGIVTVGAGATFDDLLHWALPRGWFPPVLPGTRHVTIGGAVAADVHGKNHATAGTIGRHLQRIRIHTPAQGTIDTRPGAPLFDATLGGLGLTGIVTDVDIRLHPVTTSSMLVDTVRSDDLAETLELLAATPRAYAAAWLDLTVPEGRGVVTTADHAHLDDLEARARRDPLGHRTGRTLDVPDRWHWNVVNPASIRAFNAAVWQRAPRSTRTTTRPAASFAHPLDRIGRWNLLYGARGFLQHQCSVPDGREDVLAGMLGDIHRSGEPVGLAVLKRLGARGRGLLSFPTPGWTLAVDLPAGQGAAHLIAALDEHVAGGGGRVYLAKDAALDPRHLQTMYPTIGAWRSIRDAADPDGLLVSDLDRRLDLSGRHGRTSI